MSKPTAAPGSDKQAGISIGAVMKLSGVARQTIHYYVRLGLLPRPMRTSRTYALYSRESVDLLKAIKECQNVLRLSLDEIGNLVRRAHHDPRRVWSELEELKKERPLRIRSAETRPQFLTADQVLAGLHPPPPPGWWDELQRARLLHSTGHHLPPDAAALIQSIWKLNQLGVPLEDLRPIAEAMQLAATAELAACQRATRPAHMVRGDYAKALRTLNAFDQFAYLSHRDSFAMQFNAHTHRPMDLFIGPNKKHVLPSETLLSELNLNREIDRLLNGLDRSPQNRKALADLAHAYLLRSDWFHLAGVSNKILQLEPGNVRATADLSRSLIHMGDVDQSIQLLEKRLKAGSDPLLKFRLGQAILLQALHAGPTDLLTAVRRNQQLAAEALAEARHLPAVRRWIMLDSALDNLTVSDPLQLNQPTYEELDALNTEYQQIPDRGRSVLSRVSLITGRLFAMYALYLVCRRDRKPRAKELLRGIMAIDPYNALGQRPPGRGR